MKALLPMARDSIRRCSGHCCRSFSIPYKLEELEEKQVAIRDGAMIIDMLIPLEDGKFTCRHIADNGDCSIYENRPDMCSKYPYGDRCSYQGCTLEGDPV